MYRPSELLYFRHPSPASLVYGASPIEAMAHAFDIDLAVRVYQRNFFRNSARPEVVLSTEQRLTEDEARRVLTRWRQKHQGLAHVFEPTVLDGGLKATPWPTRPRTSSSPSWPAGPRTTSWPPTGCRRASWAWSRT